MKKLIVFAAFCAAALSLSAVSADAKASDPVHYRTEGYRGSVSLTNQYLAWIGVDTSHGYMFDEHHYLGAGAGLFIVPGATPPFAHLFMEYKAYILKKNSTPVAGFKFGWMGPLNGDAPGNRFSKAAEFEPHAGWAWTFNENLGLNLTLGLTTFSYPVTGGTAFGFMPKLSIGLEF